MTVYRLKVEMLLKRLPGSESDRFRTLSFWRQKMNGSISMPGRRTVSVGFAAAGLYGTDGWRQEGPGNCSATKGPDLNDAGVIQEWNRIIDLQMALLDLLQKVQD